MTYDEIRSVYDGSNGDATKALYERLNAMGPVGIIATNLFRACKASERAKVYRGGQRGRGSYRGMAYDRKDWAINNLCTEIARQPGAVLRWGWGLDPKAINFEHVLYVDLPTGQVSFHRSYRGDGRDYPGQWDGVRDVAAERICRWCEAVLSGRATEELNYGLPTGTEGTGAESDARVEGAGAQQTLDLCSAARSRKSQSEAAENQQSRQAAREGSKNMITKVFVGWMILGAIGALAIPVVLLISYPWEMVGLSLMMLGAYVLGACVGAFARPPEAKR